MTEKPIKAGFKLSDFKPSELNKSKQRSKGIFIVKTPKEWFTDAAEIPDPEMLFDELWYEGELCFFFSTPGAGKTNLAVLIAQSIATGSPVHPETLKMTAAPQPVFFLDIELNTKQFERRYKDKTTGKYQNLSDNILRATIDFNSIDIDKLENIEDVIIDNLKEIAIEKGIKVFIIDNITSIYDPNEFRRAIKFMHKLMRLKNTLNISLLALGHTPKRDMSEPLNIYSMAGSANLPNLIDSMFALGTSYKNNNRRYIKQLKCRNEAKKYGDDNVLDIEINRDGGFLSFTICGQSEEWTHLKKHDPKENRDREIKDMYKSNSYTQKEIAEKVGLSREQVNKIINQPIKEDDLPF